MDESELARYRRRAAREGMSLSEWVRQALRRSARQQPTVDPKARLAALDQALQCDHPTGDMDELLDDIERGRDLR